MAIYFVDAMADDALEIGASASLGNIWAGGGSAMTWFNAIDYGQNGDGRFFQKGGAGFLFYVRDNNDSIHFLVPFSGGNARWEMPANQMIGQFGQWHHAAVTYDGDSTANDPVFYFDGALVSTVEIAASSGTRSDDVANDVTIGNRTAGLGSDRQFYGRMEDTRLYDRILSAAEIQTIYTSEGVDGIVQGLVGRWPMNEQTPGTAASGAGSVKDVSVNGNHATPNDSPLYEASILKSRRRAA